MNLAKNVNLEKLNGFEAGKLSYGKEIVRNIQSSPHPHKPQNIFTVRFQFLNFFSMKIIIPKGSIQAVVFWHKLVKSAQKWGINRVHDYRGGWKFRFWRFQKISRWRRKGISKIFVFKFGILACIGGKSKFLCQFAKNHCRGDLFVFKNISTTEFGKWRGYNDFGWKIWSYSTKKFAVGTF